MPSPFMTRLQAWWQHFDHGQQISLSIFAPCAALIVVLAIVSFQSSIVMPFRASRTLLQQSDQILAKQRAARAQQNTAENPGKDTDGDGLSDDDELHTYHTSPYLADTDSDGVSDGDEVRLGTDPNCPPNRDCYGTVGGADAVAQTGGNIAATSTRVGEAVLEAPVPPDQTTGAQARAYILRNHLATASDLDTLPDDAVLELYRRMFPQLQAMYSTEQIGTTNAVHPVTSSTTSDSLYVTSSPASLSLSQPTTP